jgi:hypothetical protein
MRGMVFAISKQPPYVVPGFTDKTHQGMVALSAFLLGIIPKPRPLLIPINGGYVRIQIQGDALIGLEMTAEFHKETKVKRTNVFGYGDSQRGQETADCGLRREIKQACNFLHGLIRFENLHLRRPRVTQKNAIKTICEHGTHTILALSSAFDCHFPLKALLYLVALKKPPYQTTAAKAIEMLAAEFFFYSMNMMIAFIVFFRYTLFHLLSASSMVFGISWTPPYYNSSRHFSLII